jgi:hypothetical protein
VTSIVTNIGLFEIVLRLAFSAYDQSGQVSFFVNQDGVALGRPKEKKRQIKSTGDYNVAVQFSKHGLRDTKNIADAKSDDIVGV